MKKTLLNKIKKSLHKGDQAKIAKQLGLSRNMVSLVLNGLRSNIKVIDAAIAIAESNKAKEQNQQEKIKAL